MYSIPKVNRLFIEMMAYFMGDPKRIQHFTKVHSYAKLIGEFEGLDKEELFTLETAALVHDIGIKVCEEKYGTCTGRQQEQEGPEVARELLERLEFKKERIEEVCFLVAHHHTYTGIQTRVHQILVEADFLVNLYEEGVSEIACQRAFSLIFRTPMGKTLCQTLYPCVTQR